MSSQKILRRRIHSVQNTKQLTRAMELVAASKLKKVQKQAIAATQYGEITAQVLSVIATRSDTSEHPYFTQNRAASKRLILLFASDKGLAGPFNSALANELYRYAHEHQPAPIDCIVVGRRATRYAAQVKGITLIAAYDHFLDIPDPSDFSSITTLIDSGITSGGYAGIDVIHYQFVSTANMHVARLPIYPIVIEPQALNDLQYQLEPSTPSVLTEAARLYIQSQLYRARLATSASEYALRMTAMHNATQNAVELLDDFKRELNASRQAAITNQMSELNGAIAALQP